MQTTEKKVLSCFVGAALGDAMGAVTEGKTIGEIKREFGGSVTELLPVKKENCHKEFPLGTVTDDFSFAYASLEILLQEEGPITWEKARACLMHWAGMERYMPFAGPTALAAVSYFQKHPQGQRPEGGLSYFHATNGAAMKGFIGGLFHPDDPQKICRDTFLLSAVTHPNNTGIAAACAVACATARALRTDATLATVLQAGINGAAIGNTLAVNAGMEIPGPSMEKRITLAVETAQKGADWETNMLNLAETIGSGLMAIESVPCVFGILAACPGNVLSGIRMGVNIGGDTDTVASMFGAVAGALYTMPPETEPQCELLEKANAMNIREMARRVYCLMERS